MPCFGKEIRELALVKLCLSDDTALEELLAFAVEGSVKEGKECNSIFAQNLLVEIGDRSCYVDALDDCLGGSHCC